MGLAMDAGQAGYALSQYAKASGVPVVDVTYLIDFSQQKRPGAFSLGGLEVNANLSVVPGFSRMTVFGPNGNTTTVTLNQNISVDGDFIDKHDASSGTAKTTQAAANIAGGIMAAMGHGGMMFGKTANSSSMPSPATTRKAPARPPTLPMMSWSARSMP